MRSRMGCNTSGGQSSRCMGSVKMNWPPLASTRSTSSNTCRRLPLCRMASWDHTTSTLSSGIGMCSKLPSTTLMAREQFLRALRSRLREFWTSLRFRHPTWQPW